MASYSHQYFTQSDINFAPYLLIWRLINETGMLDKLLGVVPDPKGGYMLQWTRQRKPHFGSTDQTVRTLFSLTGLMLAVVALAPLAAAETRTMTADESLRAGTLYGGLLGAGYRELWAAPIEVEVLDLQQEAGGLRPEFRVGGLQTFGLAMSGADGRSYTFRSLLKDLGQALPEDFQEYFVDDLVQDQLGATHPGAPLIVPPLAEAAGVLHSVPRLVVMPDDPALGEFREVFAGRLGTLEEFPTPASDTYAGFHGATEILSTKKIWPRLLASPDTRIDIKAFLRARLFDFLIGDWDRHSRQWRWAKLPGQAAWQPIPEDRDVAFSDYEGLFLRLFRPFRPTLLRFDATYPTRTGLTLQGWQIHRWLLPELKKSAWIEVATEMRERITDEVIDDALRQMPPSYYELSGDEMARILKQRRDNLPDIAERVYRFFAAEVDVRATDQSERVELRGLGQGEVDVSVAVQGGSDGAAPYFQRQFSPAETRSLRIYLHEGADTLVCSGELSREIKIEVIGRTGQDMVTNCEAARLRFTDREDLERRQTPARTKPSFFSHLPSAAADAGLPWTKPRDWQTRIVPIYRLSFGSDLGLFLGGGVTVDRFEFGKAPFGQRHSLQGGYAFGLSTFDVRYNGFYQHWNPNLLSSLEASISGLELSRFFGFGNETSDDGSDDFFETEQLQYKLAPSLRYVLNSQIDLFVGGALTYTSTDDDDDTLLNQLRPYGVGDFGQLSVHAGFDLDTRDRSKLYSPGLHIRVQGTLFPEVWDVEETFGAVEGQIAGYLALSQRLMLALRVGGKNVFGTFPFQEAAYIGGKENVRGYDRDRFAGDASVFANTELRFTLGQASAFLFRGEWGLFVFGDVGRVFADGENSDRWHPSGGGGISVSTLERSLLWSLTVAQSEERTTFFFQADFSF